MALNRARVARDIGLTGNLYFQIVIEYFDSAAPTVTLWPDTFTVPIGTTTAQLQQAVVTRGQEVRSALAALAAAQVAVPNQTVVTVT